MVKKVGDMRVMERHRRESPVRAIRRESGLTQARLSAAAGVSTRRVQQVEWGETRGIPAKIMAVLSLLGYDREEVRKEQEAFLRELQAEEIARLQEGL